jgi:hypothetical protein
LGRRKRRQELITKTAGEEKWGGRGNPHQQQQQQHTRLPSFVNTTAKSNNLGFILCVCHSPHLFKLNLSFWFSPFCFPLYFLRVGFSSFSLMMILLLLLGLKSVLP